MLIVTTALPAGAAPFHHHVVTRPVHHAIVHPVHHLRVEHARKLASIHTRHVVTHARVIHRARVISHAKAWHPKLHATVSHAWHHTYLKGHLIHAKATARHYTPHLVKYRVHASGISCVPFAREDSGIDLVGNAWQWWDNASGVYARGHVPQPGSVLAFRSNPHMPLGHVAVVTKVVNRREIIIDHANWTHGEISRGIPVVDVSEANDWTAVRVGLGRSDEFGSVYPTYGFIYDRADTGTMVAAVHTPAPEPVLNPAPSDLRPAAERPWQTYEEVAEAPSHPRRIVQAERLPRRDGD